jgi:hypothetical protein
MTFRRAILCLALLFLPQAAMAEPSSPPDFSESNYSLPATAQNQATFSA